MIGRINNKKENNLSESHTHTHTHTHTKENDFMKVCMEKASLGPPRSSWNYCESLLAEHFTKFILEIYLAPWKSPWRRDENVVLSVASLRSFLLSISLIFSFSFVVAVAVVVVLETISSPTNSVSFAPTMSPVHCPPYSAHRVGCKGRTVSNPIELLSTSQRVRLEIISETHTNHQSVTSAIKTNQKKNSNSLRSSYHQFHPGKTSQHLVLPGKTQ